MRNFIMMAINFFSLKDTDEERVIHSKSYNVEIMVYDKTDKVIKFSLNHFLKDIKLSWKHQ